MIGKMSRHYDEGYLIIFVLVIILFALRCKEKRYSLVCIKSDKEIKTLERTFQSTHKGFL